VTTTGRADERQWEEARDDAVQFFVGLRSDDAVRVLKDAQPEDPTGELHALLGLELFHREQYGLAAWYYESALDRQPNNQEWKGMLEAARVNAATAINVHVPPVFYFQRNNLLAPPTLAIGALPSPPDPMPAFGLPTRLRLFGGESLGRVACVAVDAVTELLGWFPGYRGRVWTNWDRRPYMVGLLILAYMRGQLNRGNLKNTYPRGSLTAFQRAGLTPPEGVTHFRTADGTWNNLCNPKEGAAGTRFLRNVTNDAIRREMAADVMSPNPRTVSRILLTREPPMKEAPFLNMLAAAWINFQNHDWIHHGEPHPTEMYDIPLDEHDPMRRRYMLQTMKVPKTQADPTYENGSEGVPITFINEVTHWWDGSQIYGSDETTTLRLRSGNCGKLRLTEASTLPLDSDGIEETGFTRNWWVGLSMFHTLFTREHNAICDDLKSAYSEWDDNRLFNVARLINAAVMAKIHNIEWTPAILPNRMVNGGEAANWYGLLTNMFKTGKSRKTVAKVNVRNIEMGGAVGNPVDKHGCPFGLTEEFVEVYRLHSLLPETIKVRRLDDGGVEEIPFAETRQCGSSNVMNKFGMADLFYSFGNQLPGQLVLNNFPQFMQEMSVPGHPVLDLGAVDILRARERGVPRYNDFRRQLRLNPIRSFRDLTDDEDTIERLETVYGNRQEDVENLDLMIGTLAEEPPTRRPKGFGFGETLFQIFILNATRRLQADRFYTDSYNEETYTKEGLQWIDAADLKTVLLRHYPELAGTGLANIKNAFEPWDVETLLDRTRHPLRWFDKELPDPWIGDIARQGGAPRRRLPERHGNITRSRAVFPSFANAPSASLNAER
jgi:Animal haem peroxidase